MGGKFIDPGNGQLMRKTKEMDKHEHTDPMFRYPWA